MEPPVSPIRLREGFKDQILYVIPRNVLPRLSEHPLVFPLMPTDIGWYPQARFHFRERETGAPENILILCLEGSGWYDVAGTRGTLRKNEALLIPRDTPHTYGASDDTPWSIYWVHFVGTNADFFARRLIGSDYILSVDDRTADNLRHLFAECCNALAAGFVLQRMIYAAQTLHHLLACLFFNNAAFSPTLQTSRFHALDATLAYLEQNIHRPLTLGDMASHAELSISHFSRLFKDQTGYAPVDYFIHLKIQTACRYLTMTSMTVREISFELGYEDPYYFSRLFKKVTGISPRQYRERPHGDFTEPRIPAPEPD